jgi:hypothetical protein
MAKPNVHSASRDDLVNAGIRAEIADEILKRRRKGAITLETLGEVPGVGPATLEQLRQALDFREQQAAAGNDGDSRANEQWVQADKRARVREGGGSVERPHREERPARTAEALATATTSSARLGVEVARDTTTAGAETAAQAGSHAPRISLQIARGTGEVAGAAARRSAQGTAEAGQALTELVQEQTRHNVATLAALSQAIDWPQVFRIQSEFVHGSLERMAGLVRRSLEASLGVFIPAAKVPTSRADRDGSEAA